MIKKFLLECILTIQDIIEYYWHWIFWIIVIGLVITFFYYLIVAFNQQYEEFHEECLKYHKKYECTAMWHAGDTQVIVIPTGR